jgi:hypothetical protein
MVQVLPASSKLWNSGGGASRQSQLNLPAASVGDASWVE